jgi:hypothetical protein
MGLSKHFWGDLHCLEPVSRVIYNSSAGIGRDNFVHKHSEPYAAHPHHKLNNYHEINSDPELCCWEFNPDTSIVKYGRIDHKRNCYLFTADLLFCSRSYYNRIEWRSSIMHLGSSIFDITKQW